MQPVQHGVSNGFEDSSGSDLGHRAHRRRADPTSAFKALRALAQLIPTTVSSETGRRHHAQASIESA
jgi:hypothetical protein